MSFLYSITGNDALNVLDTVHWLPILCSAMIFGEDFQISKELCVCSL